MNFSAYSPLPPDNLDAILAKKDLIELPTPYLDGKKYFYDNNEKKIYQWNNKYYSIAPSNIILEIENMMKHSSSDKSDIINKIKIEMNIQ
jgi:hypothetical protein